MLKNNSLYFLKISALFLEFIATKCFFIIAVSVIVLGIDTSLTSAQDIYLRPNPEPQKTQNDLPPLKMGLVLGNDGYLCPAADPLSCRSYHKIDSGTVIKIHFRSVVNPTWYFVSNNDYSQSGYLHGNNFRFLKLDDAPKPAKGQKAVAYVPHPKVKSAYDRELEQIAKRETISAKKEPFSSPKSIILPDVLEETKPKNENLVARTEPVKTNVEPRISYCSGSLYCPDASRLYDLLWTNKPSFDKDTFEKTADWEARLSKILTTFKLGENKTAADEMIFYFTDFTPLYEADAEEWTFYHHLEPAPSGKINCWRIKSPSTKSAYCLVDEAQTWKSSAYKVKMPPETAKQNNGSLFLAVKGIIVKPFFDKGTYSIRDINGTIYFSIKEVLAINPKTGAIWSIPLANRLILDNSSESKSETQEILESNTIQSSNLVKPVLKKQPALSNVNSDSSSRIISGGVLNSKASNLVKSEYPPVARVVNASGAVNVDVLLDIEGNVISAVATSGHPLLRDAAVRAARASTFRQTMLSGEPVKVSGVIVYNFTP